MYIQELLSETGIGRALHTVVGQGNIEDVLTARPEERRQYIEEAAGISKHLRRKQRAERKLSGLEQDVLRLQDVLTELRRQLKPLKQQAEMAKRHEQRTAQADELAWKLAAARLRELRAHREDKRGGWEEGLTKRTAAKERLEQLDADIERLTAVRAEAATALSAAQDAHHAAEQEKLAADRALRDALQVEADAKERRAAADTTAGRLPALRDEIARAESALRETQMNLAQEEAALEEAERTFREQERARLDAEEERRRLVEEASTHRAEVETLRRSLESHDRERASVVESLNAARAKIASIEVERERLEQEIESLDAEETPLAERQTAFEAERVELEGDISEIEEMLREYEVRRDVAQKRLASLSQTPGARFMASRGSRAIGLLRDLVRAEHGLERALTAALGSLADAVVYEDAERAVIDVRDADGAVFVLTREGRDHRPTLMEPALLGAVTADERVLGLVATILKEVYVVTDGGIAAARHREHPDATFVTRDGLLIGPTAVRTDALPDGGERGLRAEIRQLDSEINQTRVALGPKRARLDELASETQEVAAALDRADARITASAERMDHLATDLASLRKEEELIEDRLARLDESAASWREALGAPRPAHLQLPPLPPHPEAPFGRRVEVETLRRDRHRLESTLERLRGERDELAGADPAALDQAVSEAEHDRVNAQQVVAFAEHALTQAISAWEEAQAADRTAAAAEAEANRSWREAAGELEALREDYEE